MVSVDGGGGQVVDRRAVRQQRHADIVQKGIIDRVGREEEGDVAFVAMVTVHLHLKRASPSVGGGVGIAGVDGGEGGYVVGVGHHAHHYLTRESPVANQVETQQQPVQAVRKQREDGV